MEATPEEKVRQWFIEYLHASRGVPYHLMNSEVALTFGSKKYRADIVIFDHSGAPEAVVECKRPGVPLSEEVARQALRYSSILSVRTIWLTNGTDTKCFVRQDDNSGTVFKETHI